MVCSSSTFTVGGGAAEKLLCGCDGAAQDSCDPGIIVAPTGTGGPLAALGGGGEAGFGSSAPSPAQADPRTLRGNDSAGQGRRRRRRPPGLVGVHPEIQRCKYIKLPRQE